MSMNKHTPHDFDAHRTPSDLVPVERLLDDLGRRDRDAAPASLEDRIALRSSALLRTAGVGAAPLRSPVVSGWSAHRVTLSLAAVLALALSLGVALSWIPRASPSPRPGLALDDAPVAPLADEEDQWAFVLAVLESPLDDDLDDLRARSDLLDRDVGSREDTSDWITSLGGTL